MRVESKFGHLADADAIEQHRGAGPQARHRAGEYHAVDGPLSATAAILEPVNEAEGSDDDSEREHAGDDVVGLGFHEWPFCAVVSCGRGADFAALVRPGNSI